MSAMPGYAKDLWKEHEKAFKALAATVSDQMGSLGSRFWKPVAVGGLLWDVGFLDDLLQNHCDDVNHLIKLKNKKKFRGPPWLCRVSCGHSLASWQGTLMYFFFCVCYGPAQWPSRLPARAMDGKQTRK